MSIHPNISTNTLISDTFEELQFFIGKNYHKGLEWYYEKFSNRPYNQIIFEKSANYFDNHETPIDLSALLPNARLIVILSDPVDRAYSWYQVFTHKFFSFHDLDV